MTPDKWILVSILLLTTWVTASAAADGPSSVTDRGRTLAFAQPKGNCLACHWVKGAKRPGNIGPPLVAMKVRFPEKSLLRERIWDQSRFNPTTVMPPFGRNQVLTEDEIDRIVEFVWML